MKISIPREAVNKIVQDYNCSEEEASKAYLDAQDRVEQEAMDRQRGVKTDKKENMIGKDY